MYLYVYTYRHVASWPPRRMYVRPSARQQRTCRSHPPGFRLPGLRIQIGYSFPWNPLGDAYVQPRGGPGLPAMRSSRCRAGFRHIEVLCRFHPAKDSNSLMWMGSHLAPEKPHNLNPTDASRRLASWVTLLTVSSRRAKHETFALSLLTVTTSIVAVDETYCWRYRKPDNSTVNTQLTRTSI